MRHPKLVCRTKSLRVRITGTARRNSKAAAEILAGMKREGRSRIPVEILRERAQFSDPFFLVRSASEVEKVRKSGAQTSEFDHQPWQNFQIQRRAVVAGKTSEVGSERSFGTSAFGHQVSVAGP